ncbi:MAG: SIR2 family protein [Actinomycetota bacterium]|nr:SIR2 family protein [Actinomycetota bacterium]
MIEEGMVIPFLGAGASLGVARARGEQAGPPTYLPSGSELAAALARREPAFPSKDPMDVGDLAKVASWYVTNNSRQTMRVLLRRLLSGEYERSPLHDLLAASPRPQLVFTTNYDSLLEEAFIRAGKPFDLVVYPADQAENANALLWWEHGASEPENVHASTLDLDPSSRTVIYKMHGTLAEEMKWDNFVITEDDYVRFLSQLSSEAAVPACFYPHFDRRSFLFLGYGLKDWTFRVVLHGVLFARQQPSTADAAALGWAVQKKPSVLEQELWRARGVRIYDIPLETFVEELAAV